MLSGNGAGAVLFAGSAIPGIRPARVDIVAGYGLPDLDPVDRPFVGQCLESGDGDMVPVHLEKPAQRGAGVAAAEAVGAQRGKGWVRLTMIQLMPLGAMRTAVANSSRNAAETSAS